MAHAISRIYANTSDADAAVRDLAEYGFQPEEIHVVAAQASAGSVGGAGVDGIADRIAKCLVPMRDAVAYAKHVGQGGAFVTVHAPFGSGRKATAALDRHHPIDLNLKAPGKPIPKYDEAAPLSSSLWLPVLIDNPAPLGAFAGLPSLVSGPPRVTEAAPLSSSMGWPVRSSDPTPISTASGAPTLASSSATFSNLLGLGTLWNSAAPLSRILFLPVLSRSGAPMSLGLPLLWR
jgi:hypothetical protein